MNSLLILYFLVASALCGSLAMFVSLKRDLHRDAARNRKRLEELASRPPPETVPPAEPVFVAPAALRSGWNLNKRVQAMRMVRHNEDVSTIAAALGVTRREVELLIRVQTMGRAISSVEK